VVFLSVIFASNVVQPELHNAKENHMDEIKDLSCQDDPTANCLDFKDKCVNNLVKAMCPLTCGICKEYERYRTLMDEHSLDENVSEREFCKDAHNNCPKYKEKCEDPNILDLCPVTCGQCEELQDEQEYSHEGIQPFQYDYYSYEDEEEEDNYHGMYFDEGSLSSVACVEKSKHCSRYKDKCDDPNIREICPETCGLCTRRKLRGNEEQNCTDIKQKRTECPFNTHRCFNIHVLRSCPKTCGGCNIDFKALYDTIMPLSTDDVREIPGFHWVPPKDLDNK
ncbi:unnamed protein product, partial [Meganyctiphanes norvegica]